MQNTPTRTIAARTWAVMVALSLTGQIVWAVENSWFNTFVFDTITPDPRPVAWMVAASAITATLTTLLMGTLSDRTRSRWGRRRPYILIGYILWGLSTVLFPTVAYIKVASLAVMIVVIADSVMTFFGSTANDAAFSAWTADIASVAWLKDLLPEQNRGKFLGIRMIFWIAIPMVLGPWIGSTLILKFGIPTTFNGEAGFIPVPIVFQVGSVIALLSLIPLVFIRSRRAA